MYFEYGEKEIEHLKARDQALGRAIETIGRINRPVERDLFASVVQHIIGQQISKAAHATIVRRLNAAVGPVTPEAICSCGVAELQALGMTFRKAGYIKDFAHKVQAGQFDMGSLRAKSDAQVIAELTTLRGVGPWTAEMILIFCLQRPDILSYGDLAIRRGLCMLYRHPSIDKDRFEQYRRRYSPYGTTASLYIWAIAGGAIESMRDHAPKKSRML